MTISKFPVGLKTVAAALLAMAISAPQALAADPVRTRGTVVSLNGGTLIVHPTTGADVTVNLADKFAAFAVVKSSMSEIKTGTFIGTATTTNPDTSLRSLEVVVFPDALKGFGEGHYPWDLPGSSMMTNATVTTAVKSVEGQTLTVSYKGGEKKVVIPADVPVVTLVPATAADIVPGEAVFVPGQREADGSIHAGAVLFGKDGLVPPM